MRSKRRRFPGTPFPRSRETIVPGRRWFSVTIGCVMIVLVLFTAELAGGEAGGDETLGLRWPDETKPPPGQLEMSRIASIPTKEAECPVCGSRLALPMPERLYLVGKGAENTRWEMEAAARDADMCPHPRNGVNFQADIGLCPGCGFAGKSGDFAQTYPEEFNLWVHTRLKPNALAALRRLAPRSAVAMDDEELSKSFSDQGMIPDVLRLDHARAVYEALRRPRLERAEMHWLSAWANRRAGLPGTDTLLGKRVAAVAEMIEASFAGEPGVAKRIEILSHLLHPPKKNNKAALGGLDAAVGALLLSRLQRRAGEDDDAGLTLGALDRAARERYARPDQDPFWHDIGGRIGDKERSARLDAVRTELLRTARGEQARLDAEKAELAKAADLLREALDAGDFGGRRRETAFYTYLTGEFRRRAGGTEAAAEWYAAAAGMAAENDGVRRLSDHRLAAVSGRLGVSASVLASAGRDGELLGRVKESVTGAE